MIKIIKKEIDKIFHHVCTNIILIFGLFFSFIIMTSVLIVDRVSYHNYIEYNATVINYTFLIINYNYYYLIYFLLKSNTSTIISNEYYCSISDTSCKFNVDTIISKNITSIYYNNYYSKTRTSNDYTTYFPWLILIFICLSVILILFLCIKEFINFNIFIKKILIKYKKKIKIDELENEKLNSL